ncbi:MAG TPA: DUF4835 family protein [Bacteroidota bacterium]|nr:DUF4835 family protein [Bacteroidota bacterium]
MDKHFMRTKSISLFLICLLLSLIYFSTAESQELNITVSINNTEQLNSQARDNLQDFAAQVARYLNSQKYTKEDLGDYKIKCSMQVSFQTSPTANHYTAQAVIASERPINRAGKNTVVWLFRDDNWEFDYIRGQQILHDDFKFDPFTSFLDFYANVIIGFDFDSYKEMDGTPYFEKGEAIANLGRNSSVAAGWTPSRQGLTSRGELIDELVNTKYQDFRIAVYKYHFRGLDWLAQRDEEGKKNMLAALNRLSNLRKKLNENTLLINVFFETKYQEIGTVFKGYEEGDILQELSAIDPAHAQKYADLLK